ncbi:insulinase family protein [Patescibacteria group bacterium]|nr:insulinase family protein [Patescibacteria group bacterium]
MYDPYADFTVHALSNGVPVYILYLPERSFAWAEFVFHAGMRDEQEYPAGTAHFLEHMVCANSGMTLMEMKRFFGEVGGMFDAFTGFESTRYSFMTPTTGPEFDQGLVFWAKASLGKSLENYFDREMEIINSEIKKRHPNVEMMKMANKVPSIHYRGLPWSKAPSAAGTLESLKDIRPETIQHFYDFYYTTNNLSVLCVGGLAPDVVLAKLEATVASEKMNGVRNPLPQVRSSFPKLRENDLEFSLVQGVGMGQVSLDFKALLPGDVSFEAAEVAAEMITELLYTEVREKRGLAYGMGAGSYARGPFHDLFVSVSNIPAAKVDEVRMVVTEIFHSFSTDKLLFEGIKRKRVASFLTRDSTLQKITDAAAYDLAMFGRIVTLRQEMSACEEVTIEDVEQIARFLNRSEDVLRITVFK